MMFMLTMIVILELLLQCADDFVAKQEAHLFHWDIRSLRHKKIYEDPHCGSKTDEQKIKFIASVCETSWRCLKISNRGKPEAFINYKQSFKLAREIFQNT
jgi:hypothetical protein